MKKKKVFIISFNKLDTNFWRQYLNFENSCLYHWSNPEQALNNLDTIWPDVIIIDAYFTQKPYEFSLLKSIRLKSNIKIFCLTPLPKALNKTVFIDERLFVSKLDNEVIEKINNAIKPIRLQNHSKLTA